MSNSTTQTKALTVLNGYLLPDYGFKTDQHFREKVLLFNQNYFHLQSESPQQSICLK